MADEEDIGSKPRRCSLFPGVQWVSVPVFATIFQDFCVAYIGTS